jgi:AcrR family transcriptional regulator
MARVSDDRILDAALDLAEQGGWYELRMHLVADRARLPLAELLRRFRDPDAIADEWFRRASLAMVGDAPPEGPPAARVEAALMRWFLAQEARKPVVAQMLRAKLHPSHAHHWVPLPFHLSRLIHTALEAARLDRRGLARQAEEVGLTLLFLRVLPLWLRDASPGAERTRAALRRGLAWLDRLPGG